jgi:capsular exopolysaccharide synthesis family protein
MPEDNRLLPVPNVDNTSPLQQRGYRPDYRYANPYGVEQYTDKNYLRQYIGIILKRKWIILSIMIIVTCATAMYMYRIPSTYESQTTILIEKNPTAALKTKEMVINLADDPKYWQTQLRLLQNPELARDVVLKLNLHNNSAFLGDQTGPGLWAAIKHFITRKSSNAPKPTAVPVVNDSANVGLVTEVDKLTPEQKEKVDGCAGMIQGGLQIEPVLNTNLVTLRYQHTRPEMAAAVVDGVAKVFIENSYKRETGGQKLTKEEVAKAAAELKQKVEQLEEARLNYLKNRNVPIDPTAKGSNINLERLQMVSEQLLKAEDEMKVLRAAYSSAVGAKDIYSIPEVKSDESIQEASKIIAELEGKRGQLLVKYTNEHPEVMALDEQIRRAKEYRDKSAREAIASLKSRYEATQRRRDELAQDYERELAKANKDGVDMTRLGTLNQEIETTKQLYNSILQRQQEIQLGQEDKAQNNITIATEAKVPGSPIGPQRTRNIIISFFVALFAGIGLAFLLDFIDDTLKSVDDVSRYVQLPTLAIIPHSKDDKKFLRAKNQAGQEAGNATALVTMSDARSPMAEAYRHLRTSLLFSSAGRPPKTILITSGQPMEGKTTTAINTAISLAQTGADTIIVDCDLRRPRVHAYFGMENEKGLTNYLSGERDLSGLIQTYDKLTNLKVLACGPISPNPAELLGSEEMRGLLETLKENFTHILVDTPPILSFTDAAILATQVDGVLVVARSGRSSRTLVRRVRQRLTDVGAKVFGVVLNGMRANSGDYGYGYGYGYGYSYGYYSRYYGEEERSGR